MSKGFTALISVMAIIFIGLSFLFGFKSCVNGAVAREKIVETQIDNISIEQENLFNSLKQLSQNVKFSVENEKEFQMQIAQLRSKGNVAATDKNIQVAFENPPTWMTGELLKDMGIAIQKYNENVARSKKAYRSAVESYEYYTEKWPNKSAISSQGYVIKVYEHFTDSQPSKKQTDRIPLNVKLPESKFAYVSIKKEHYTRHTRIVAHTTTVNGKTQTVYKTEVYYTWDFVWGEENNVKQIKFAGVVFPYGTVKPNKIYKYLGTDTHGNDRYIFDAELTDASGIAFTHIEDNKIEKCTLHQEYSNTTEDFKKFLDDKLMGNGLRYAFAFWIVFVLVGVFGVVVFCVLDND